MVELSKRKRDIRGDGGNHQEILGLQRISCGSKSTIHPKADTSPDPAVNNTDRRSSKPNQASHTLDFSGLLVSCISFTSSSPISLIFIHNSTIVAEHKVKSSLFISPCNDHELTLSAAYTEYSIHLRLSAVRSFSSFRVDP